jgi:hypothetical protein
LKAISFLINEQKEVNMKRIFYNLIAIAAIVATILFSHGAVQAKAGTVNLAIMGKPAAGSGVILTKMNSGDVKGTLTVTAANNPPTDISLSKSSVNENLPIGSLVGALTAFDPDVADTHTFSLSCATPGMDDGSFNIVGNNLRTAAVFDNEKKNSYAICVRADDGQGGIFDKNFAITVNNLIEKITRIIRSTDAEDGWILESGENTLVGGTMNSDATLRVGDDANRKQYRSILSFATGPALPDTAVLTRVTLMVKLHSVTGGGDPLTMFQGFMLDIRKGFFGTTALQTTDWQATASRTVGPFTPSLYLGRYSIDLTSFRTYINKMTTGGGLTQIRLRFNLDDNNDAVANYLKFWSGSAGGLSRPKLIIEFYVP